MPSKTGVNSKCMLTADVSLTCATKKALRKQQKSKR